VLQERNTSPLFTRLPPPPYRTPNYTINLFVDRANYQVISWNPTFSYLPINYMKKYFMWKLLMRPYAPTWREGTSEVKWKLLINIFIECLYLSLVSQHVKLGFQHLYLISKCWRLNALETPDKNYISHLFHLTNIQKGKIKNKQRREENFKTLKPVLIYGSLLRYRRSWKFGRNRKSWGNIHLQLVFPQHFSFFKTFTRLSFCNSIETQYTFSFSQTSNGKWGWLHLFELSCHPPAHPNYDSEHVSPL